MSDYDIRQETRDDGTMVVEVTDGDGDVVYRQTHWADPDRMPGPEEFIELSSELMDPDDLEQIGKDIQRAAGGSDTDRFRVK